MSHVFRRVVLSEARVAAWRCVFCGQVRQFVDEQLRGEMPCCSRPFEPVPVDVPRARATVSRHGDERLHGDGGAPVAP
jgi:hypothetical protein